MFGIDHYSPLFSTRGRSSEICLSPFVILISIVLTVSFKLTEMSLKHTDIRELQDIPFMCKMVMIGQIFPEICL